LLLLQLLLECIVMQPQLLQLWHRLQRCDRALHVSQCIEAEVQGLELQVTLQVRQLLQLVV
jgi:hypothetical protein